MSLSIESGRSFTALVDSRSERFIKSDPLIDSEDFVSKVIEIVKTSAAAEDFDAIDKDVFQIAEHSQLSLETIYQLIEQVKDIKSLAGRLPIVYRHLILSLQLQSKYRNYNTRLSVFNETFRITCAKLALEREDICLFCKNIQEYGIQSQPALIEIAKLVLKQRFGALSLCEHIGRFGIKDQEALIEIAKCAAKINSWIFPEFIQNYAIESEEARIELAKWVVENGGIPISRYIKNFNIKKQEALIEIAKCVVKKDGSFISKFIENYGIDSEEARAEIAKLAAKSSGDETLRCIKKYHLEKEVDRFEVARIAMQNPETRQSLKEIDLSLKHRIFLFIQAVHDYPIFMQCADLFFHESIAALKNYPELRLFDLSDDFNIVEFLFDFWEEESVPYTLITKPRAESIKLDKETDPAVKALNKQWLILYCCVLDFTRKSKPLRDKMIALLDKIKEEPNPHVKEQKIHWIAFTFLMARIQEIQTPLFLDKFSLFETLLDLRDPSLRFSLLFYFIDMLSLSALAKEQDKHQHKPMQILSCLLASYFSQIAPYEEITKTGKDRTFSRIVSFKDRVQELLGQKFFKDKEQLKSLLRSLLSLLKTTQLSDKEKGRVLRDLIFIKNPALQGKSQSQQLLLSAQIISQLIACNAWDRLAQADSVPKLQEQIKDLLVSTLHLEIEDFNDKFFKTIGTWRKSGALLTYVSKIHTFHEKDKIVPFLKVFVESVLNNHFAATRYDVGPDASEHMIKLHTQAPQLLANWKMAMPIFHFENYDIQDTDDPCDLLLCGTDVSSCQKVDGDPELSKCLIAYLLDGKIRMMAVKNKQGTIVARCMLRLLWNQSTRKFVLFQEQIYPKGWEDKFSKMLERACLARAKQLSVPLFVKRCEPSAFLHTLEAFTGKIPFEYVDALSNSMQKDEGYRICECSLVE